MKVKVSVYPLICLLYALAFIAVGVVVLAQGSLALEFVAYIGGIIVAFHGIIYLLTVCVKRKILAKSNFRTMLANALLNVAAGIFLITLPGFALKLVYVVFVVYILANGLVKLVDFFLKYWNDIKECWIDLAKFAFFFTFTILLIFIPDMQSESFKILTGIYCILYGAGWVGDFVVQVLPLKSKEKIKNTIRLVMPVGLSTFKPFVTVKKFGRTKMLNPDLKIPTSPVTFYPEGKETTDLPDLEIMIHVSKDGVGIIGHCDTYFDGEILSYGSYDAKTLSLFGGVADGVFFTADKQRYLRFSVTHDTKTIFGYGLRLTDEEKEQVRAKIKELKDNTYLWKAPMHIDWEEKGKVRRSDYKDYGSKLWNGVDAHFYKFNDGIFKTYFVMTSNCVMLADTIISPLGINIAGTNGILSPGCYYDYFEKQLSMKDSRVFCKTVYDIDTTADWEGKFGEVIPPEDFLEEKPAEDEDAKKEDK